MKKSILSLFTLPLLLVASDAPSPEMLKEGKAIYEQTCISCHGIDGQTDKNMKLVVKPRKLNKTILTKEQSVKMITEGAHYWGAHSDLMPSFKPIYDAKQIESIATYISYTFNPDREKKVKELLAEVEPIAKEDQAKMLKTGKKIFKRNCSMCHGLTGNGKSEYVEQSKESDVFIYPYDLTKTLLSEDQIFLYAKYGGHYWGTDKTDMPSWKRKYNDFKLKSVAKFVEEEIKKTKD